MTITVTRLYWAHALIRQYLITGRKHALIKKYALNKHVRLLTRLYGNRGGRRDWKCTFLTTVTYGNKLVTATPTFGDLGDDMAYSGNFPILEEAVCLSIGLLC